MGWVLRVADLEMKVIFFFTFLLFVVDKQFDWLLSIPALVQEVQFHVSNDGLRYIGDFDFEMMGVSGVILTTMAASDRSSQRSVRHWQNAKPFQSWWTNTTRLRFVFSDIGFVVFIITPLLMWPFAEQAIFAPGKVRIDWISKDRKILFAIRYDFVVNRNAPIFSHAAEPIFISIIDITNAPSAADCTSLVQKSSTMDFL